MAIRPEDEQSRGLTRFEGQALTHAEELGMTSSGFLIPISREQGRNIMGFTQAASRALNDTITSVF